MKLKIMIDIAEGTPSAFGSVLGMPNFSLASNIGMDYLHTLDPPIVHCDLRRFVVPHFPFAQILLTWLAQSKYHACCRRRECRMHRQGG
jgi:hypothetical protein